MIDRPVNPVNLWYLGEKKTCPKAVKKAMAPKGGAAKAVRNVKKVVEKVDHRNRMFTHIKAGMANASPPLGTQLGQVGINVQAFVKDFNLKSSVMKQGSQQLTYY